MSGTSMNESLRTLILETLNEFYCPVQLEDIRACTDRFSASLESFSSALQLTESERSAWETGSVRRVWICPAFTHMDAVANRDFLTRSDWSLENRILIDADDRVRRLWLVRVFCDQYLIAQEEGSKDASAIIARLRHHSLSVASALPKGTVQQLTDESRSISEEMIESLREATEDAHAALAAQGRPLRLRLASEMDRWDEPTRLFGTVGSR